MAKLYIVDVTVDCPEDLTLRALRVLKQVSLIVAPGGDGTLLAALGPVLANYGLQIPVCLVPADDAEQGVHAVLEALAHGDVAWLWHEAADARAEAPKVAWSALRALCERGVDPISVPGPSTAVSALAISGFPTVPFALLGPLPSGAEARRAALNAAAREQSTMVCTVSAGALAAVLNDCLLLLGDRQIALWHAGRMWRGRTSEASIPPGQGPITLIIAGTVTEEAWNEEKVREQVRVGLGQGRSARDVARDIAGRSGWSRKKLYAMATELRSHGARGPRSR